MIYLTLLYFIFVVALLVIYYVLPKKQRWISLLLGNVLFYYFFCKEGFIIFIFTIVISFFFGHLIENSIKRKMIICFIAVACIVLPWFLVKESNFIISSIFHASSISWIVPVGISFYSLQIISYFIDIYRGNVKCEKNIFKYALYISFFPQILQGPIPRYNDLRDQLVEGRQFDESKIIKGIYHILWGFFLKYLIADKAGIVVDTVYSHYMAYTGAYVWVAAFLYSIQLYTDFMSCTELARGVSLLFGIELTNNFAQPYFSRSVKEFWKRWHISLSSWLRDYIYIPLGGNRKGLVRKYIFLGITFFVSGVWHGSGVRFIVWAMLHVVYQILGEMFHGVQLKCSKWIGVRIVRDLQIAVTFILISISWIIFRAESLKKGLYMIKNMFLVFNPWVLFNDRLFTLGLSLKEIIVLAISCIILIKVSLIHEAKVSISEKMLEKKFVVRYLSYIIIIAFIWIFGTYGYGYDAKDFIYGGF